MDPNGKKHDSGDANESNSKSSYSPFVTFKQFKSARTFWESQLLDQSNILREILVETGAIKQWVCALDPAFAKQSAFMHDSDLNLKKFESPDIKTLIRKLRSLLNETGILISNSVDEESNSCKFPVELKQVYKSYVRPSVSFENIGKAETTFSSHGSINLCSVVSPRSCADKTDINEHKVNAVGKTQKSQNNEANFNNESESNRFKSVPVSDQALAELVKLIQILLASNEKNKSTERNPSEVGLPPSIYADTRKINDGEGPSNVAGSKSSCKRGHDSSSGADLVESGRMEHILSELRELKAKMGESDAKIAKLSDTLTENKDE